MSETNLKELLYKSFDNIPTRKGHGGVYSYIRWQDVADRMNEVYGQCWGSEVIYQEIIDNNVILRVRVTITDFETGKVYYQEGFGGASNDSRLEAGNAFKSAYSKALKDACKKWGIGLFIEEDGIGISSTEIQNSDTLPPSPPASEPLPPFNIPTSTPKSSGTPMSLPEGVSMSSLGASKSMPERQQAKFTSTPPIPSVRPSTIPIPPVPTVPTDSIPSVPPVSTPSIIDKSELTEESGPEYISNVQKAALQSILNIKNVEYEDLVKKAFELNNMDKEVPTPDMLTYADAVCVIKYGNDKFRR